jgi:type IV secretion system protein VirB4
LNQLLEGALASIKQVRKNLGGVTLIGQSANDLGENASRLLLFSMSAITSTDATCLPAA